MFGVSRFERLRLPNLMGLDLFDALDRSRLPNRVGDSATFVLMVWNITLRIGNLTGGSPLHISRRLLDRLHITLPGPMVVQDVFEVLLAGVVVLSDRRAFGG
jgi:hypothetical protein